MVVWDGKDGRSVADINPDDRFLGLSHAYRFKESRGEIAAPRGVDDQICRKRFALPVTVLKVDCGHPRAVWCRHDGSSATMLTDGDVGMSLDAPSHDRFDQWPRHRIGDPSEIPPRKRIVTRGLDPNIKTDPQRHRAGRREVLLNAREEICERALAAAKQPMHVRRLRRPAAV